MDEMTPDRGVLKQRVTAILRETFRDVEVEFIDNPAENLSGFVTTPDFSEIDPVERQLRLRTALRKGLGPDTRFITMLFTSSPEETAAIKGREPSLR